jgi:hypothetical protein
MMNDEFLTLNIHHSSFIIHHFFKRGAKIHFIVTSETKVQQKPNLCRLIFNDKMADIPKKCLPFVVKQGFLRFYTEGSLFGFHTERTEETEFFCFTQSAQRTRSFFLFHTESSDVEGRQLQII